VTIALVLGSASTVWADVERALGLGSYDVVLACNDMGAAWPGRLDAHVSLHSNHFGIWLARRRALGHPPARRVVGSAAAFASTPRLPDGITDHVEHRFPGQTTTGSSGLFAVKFALDDLGCERAVVCGMPLQTAAGHFHNHAPWTSAEVYQAGWREARPHLAGRVRSLGGWTAELLGTADAEFVSQ
jgi:hypothetical protein